MTVTEVAVKRPTLVVVAFTILGILGMISYTKLNYDFLPKMSIPYMSISTTYVGASASEVETSVTKELEDALASLENVKSMQSTSQEGMSTINIELQQDADINLAMEDAQRKVNSVSYKLPAGVKTPSITKFSTSEMPVMQLGVKGDMSPTELYKLVDDEIKPQLSKINGVGLVNLVGGTKRQVRININKDKIEAYKLSINDIYSAISNANIEMPNGKIEGDFKQYSIRVLGKMKSLEDLKNTIVSRNSDTSSVKLSDIAEVTDGIADAENISRINGRNSIGLVVQKQSDANTVDVCNKLKSQLTSLEKQYSSKDIKFDIASDNSTYTLNSANAVMEDLMLAVVLVAVVMFLFLHNIRNSFIVLVSIPTSIISVFIAMYIFNFSLNLLTLMALSLIVGILVDDSIVVLENITRHLEMGKDRRIAALDGRNEIGFSAVAITLVDVVVFLPLAMVSGMVGGLLKEFSLVIVFSTLMSLIVSFTVTPLLASKFGNVKKITTETFIGRFALKFEDIFNNIVSLYERILHWGLNHRKTVYAIALSLMIVAFSLAGFGLIGTSFMAEGDRGEFVVKIEGDAQNTLQQTSLLTEKVENILLKKPEVIKVLSSIGYSSDGMDINAQTKSDILVSILPKDKRNISVNDYAEQVKKELSNIPGIKVTAAPTSMFGGSDDAPIQILLRGPITDSLFVVGHNIIKEIKNIPGITDVRLSIDKTKPELQVKLNRQKMELLGVTVQQVGKVVNLSFAGDTDLKYSDKGKDYDINVKYDKIDRAKIEDLLSLKVLNDKGESVELRSFANVTQTLASNKLERYNKSPSLMVKANVSGRPVGTVGSEVQSTITKNIHLGNITVDYLGQMQQQADAFGSLFIALLMAVIFVYLVMVALYNSYLYPFVVMFSLPVAIIGALFALALSGEPLTIYSIIGIIMLMGLVAKNAILIVDFANKQRETGMGIVESLISAGKERLRPILMTTMAMVFGMLPMAIASGAGAESKNGLAWVIIGGLTSSLLLTLVLVPSIYMTMESKKEKIKQRIQQRRLKKAEKKV